MRKNFVLVLFVFSFFIKGALGANYKEDIASIYFKTSKPSRVFGSALGLDKPIERNHDFGGGFAYNGLRIDGSQLTAIAPSETAYRFGFSKDFFYRDPINIYLGINYLIGVHYYDRQIKKNIDGLDVHFGASLNLFNVLKPYAEVSVIKNYFVFGIRVHVYKKIKRKNSLTDN